jgi:predicted metal-binding membrane protein
MAAMMFPAMIPVVLVYDRMATKTEKNPRIARLVGTPLFLGGYLIIYALLGICAYLAVYAALMAASALPWLAVLSAVAPSAVLVATGVYQFSALKGRCLSNCVSPLGFFATHLRRGLSGSVRMGFSHGSFCVGCCWAYMLVMLAVGAMSLPVMAALSGMIALEKVVARGSVWFNRGVALVFVGLGVAAWFSPGLLGVL